MNWGLIINLIAIALGVVCLIIYGALLGTESADPVGPVILLLVAGVGLILVGGFFAVSWS